jgi:hypothetical protein
MHKKKRFAKFLEKLFFLSQEISHLDPVKFSISIHEMNIFWRSYSNKYALSEHALIVLQLFVS